jgi:D-sedoheptulose 7-phosphate isomerase
MGNGGSNAIASHIAEDYTKTLKIVSTSFSDGARLTCYANDYGYENAFKEFVKEFSQPNGLVILISSSGNSKNIVNCADYCQKHNIQYIILTGFNERNKLREYSENALLDFWVNSTDYGIVECAHEIILHSII